MFMINMDICRLISIKDESVSRTLESCYDDYCAAQLAKSSW